MFRIYHDEIAAIVVDEVNRCFCYTTISKARQITKGIQTIISRRSALYQREEYLLELGYEKESFIS